MIVPFVTAVANISVQLVTVASWLEWELPVGLLDQLASVRGAPCGTP